MLTEAVILAGGFGSRLQTVVNDVPKPMAPINNKPFLNYVFAYLKYYGIKHVVLSTGYLAHKISDYYKDECQGITITYANEAKPLGTGGGIRLALQKCKTKNVLVLNGDSFFDVNITDYYKQHIALKATHSLALRNVNNASRYGTIELALKNIITSFKEKNDTENAGLINGGVYIINNTSFLNATKSNTVFSIEKDFFEAHVTKLNLCGFTYKGYFIDIGIPNDYKQAQTDFENFKYL